MAEKLGRSLTRSLTKIFVMQTIYDLTPI